MRRHTHNETKSRKPLLYGLMMRSTQKMGDGGNGAVLALKQGVGTDDWDQMERVKGKRCVIM